MTYFVEYDEDLTDKERLFIIHYLTNNRNGTQAAISAGYSKNSACAIASENLRKPHIRFVLDRELKKIEKKLKFDFEDKANLLWGASERCAGKTGHNEFDVSGIVNTISELNKMQGHYAPVRTVNSQVTLQDTEILEDLVKKNEKEY